MLNFSRIRQSGILPFRVQDGELWVLLVTSLETQRWIVPKGRLEPGLTARESAEYEAFEEAGVAGRLETASIGSYRYKKRPEKGGAWCLVRVFPMGVEREFDEYPHAGLRTRKWMPIAEAAKTVDDAELGELILKFGESRGESI
ncbi:MAG: NUDIX hydrolase [Alphaproteobacteria bacterium]|nr:NUDIX hydrolase [Alphaproteobacteria bacterium]|tara:strand:- start:1063 stop:1494 length:432 start_codon:yes stop_codon:yes gene_type:complete